jgi:hypothetical protein
MIATYPTGHAHNSPIWQQAFDHATGRAVGQRLRVGMLDDAVGAGEQQAFVPVGETDQVRRPAIVAADLDYDAEPVPRANRTTADVQSVAHRGLHLYHLSSK